MLTQFVYSQTDNQKAIDSLKREILLLKLQNGLLTPESENQNGNLSESLTESLGEMDFSGVEINSLVDKILDSQLTYFELAVDQINVEQMEGLIDVVQNHKVTQIMRDKLIKELTYFKNKVESEIKTK